ncbi:MAG: methionyl-tRNA formyltransferase [Rubrivivax sp.]
MRLAFAGTPEFAATALMALHDAGHEIVLVLTQPDRPAGRGLRLQPSPVKRLAQTLGAALAQPRSLRLDGRWPEDARQVAQALSQAAPEVMVVAAYGLILPPWVLQAPARGCLNIHASLLPRWRGAAPIQRAIEAGDATTGVTIMQMDAGLDTGAMLLEAAVPIGPQDTAATLHDRLAALGADLVVQALQRLQAGTLVARAQPEPGACYAPKITKEEARLDWRSPAALLERRLRAFDPFPGASFEWADETVKLWRATVWPQAAGAPGEVLEVAPGRLAVACGSGALEPLEVQRPAGRRIAFSQYRQGGPGAQWHAGLHLPGPH